MKIYEALKKGRAELNLLNIESASLDASLILSHLTGLSKVGLIAHDTDELEDKLVTTYFSLIRKRGEGYPVAYILGYREFWGLKLKVNEHTLIPRPDTEVLVENALLYPVKGNVLDLGTGSGAIILALKSELQDKICAYACDISSDTLAVARENAQNLNLEVRFIQSDWFKAFDDIRFSMIVSNPPYIEDEDLHLLQTSLPFEPKRALTSGTDGLNDIRLICSQAPKYLTAGAPLLIEHGYNQGAAVRKIFIDNGYIKVRTVKDYAGLDRVTVGEKS